MKYGGAADAQRVIRAQALREGRRFDFGQRYGLTETSSTSQ